MHQNNPDDSPVPKKLSRLKEIREKISSKRESSVERINFDLQKVENLEHMWKESKELLCSASLMGSVELFPQHLEKSRQITTSLFKHLQSDMNKKNRTTSLESRSGQQNLKKTSKKNLKQNKAPQKPVTKTEKPQPANKSQPSEGLRMIKSNLDIRYRLRPQTEAESIKNNVKKIQDQYKSPYSQKETTKNAKTMQRVQNESKTEKSTMKKSGSDIQLQNNMYKKRVLGEALSELTKNSQNSFTIANSSREECNINSNKKNFNKRTIEINSSMQIIPPQDRDVIKPNKSQNSSLIQSKTSKPTSSASKTRANDKYSYFSPRNKNNLKQVKLMSMEEISVLNTTSNSNLGLETEAIRQKKKNQKKEIKPKIFKQTSSSLSFRNLTDQQPKSQPTANEKKKMDTKNEKSPGSKTEENHQLKTVLKSKIENFVSEIEKYNTELLNTRDAMQQADTNYIPQINTSCKTLLKLLKIQQGKIG